MNMRLIALLPLLLLVCTSSTIAHGDLDLRIQAISAAIESSPDSASLYFQRGKLRFQHEEYQLSIDDINISINKGFSDDLQKIYLAKSLFNLEDYQSAQIHLGEYLSLDPENVVGLNLKGRILYAQKEYEKSALCFESVIDLTIKSLPENYLEAVQSWDASNHPDKHQKIFQILELGLENLGPIVTLQNKLIESHLKYNENAKAINLQKSIIDKSRRKESAYFKLAEIYYGLGEFENAKNALLNAQSHWNKLPRRIQNNSAMEMLRQNIKQLITKLQ